MKKIMLTLMVLLLVPAIALGATVLEVGSNGSDVTKVQKRLIQYGYHDRQRGRQIRRKDA